MTITAAASSRRSTSAEPPIATVAGVVKRYGGRVVVDDVSFRIPRGSVTGLVGPNGAGKTTILAMLLGLVHPNSGQIRVLGESPRHRRRYLDRVGSLIETPAFHPAVSGRDNLMALCRMNGSSGADIDRLLDDVGLAGRAKDRVGDYSLGMTQRLGIAAALLGSPDLVILDEPTNGLDPVGMREIRALIDAARAAGQTVLVSSHLLNELEHVCDWLVVIDHGGLVFEGAPAGLGDQRERLVATTSTTTEAVFLRGLLAADGFDCRTERTTIDIALDPGSDVESIGAQINSTAHEHGVVLSSLHRDLRDLETRYLELVEANLSNQPIGA